MHWHADNSTYGWLLQGLAISPNITGPYTFLNATAPFGNWSQDFGTFTDYKTQKSYALYSNGDRKEARDVYLAAYDDSNTELAEIVHRFDKYDLEAPTIIQTDSSYYALMSHKTGYRPNNVVAFRANSLSGPWSQPLSLHWGLGRIIPSLAFRSRSTAPKRRLGCIWVISGTRTPFGKADISGCLLTLMTTSKPSNWSGMISTTWMCKLATRNDTR